LFEADHRYTEGVSQQLYMCIVLNRFLRSALQLVVEESIVERRKIIEVQSRLTSNLQTQLETLQSSMDALKSLTRETIKLQYQMLPARYLLVVDGKRANPRKHVARLVSMFCQFRRTSLLAMVMGTWKILLKHEESVAKRPQYAKAAALHLMVGWVQNIKYKQMSNFAHRWIAEVQLMIFKERCSAVLPLQTLYRVWRDRRRFIRMHKMAIYGGPLSDIYLAPARNVAFFIPLVIRTGRRATWFAAVTIQSAWKSSRLWRIYQVRRKQVVLIQSLGRMWPRRVWFLRLRVTAVKCQAWMRRTVKKVQYLRLRRCTIIVQKYIRRYLATLLKWRKLGNIWYSLERRMAAVIRVQCRWRIFVATRKVQRKKDYIRRRLWAVLTLQRCWYKSKGAFHTFLLMGCYRETTLEDETFSKYVVDLGRFRAARRIQRIYRDLYRRRLISAIIKVQCWYRGRLGYNLVDILRREKWASRKLHHWARGMMRWKHKRARQIQLWWWRQKCGRLRRHLHYEARMLDRAEDRALALVKYRNASLIQAFAHGVWSRRWTKRHKAAITIQKPTRFYLARKRWKRELRERSLGAVTRYVSSLLSRGVRDRTTYLVRLHSRMLIKPQSVARGFIVRCYYHRALTYAYKLGVSVVKVQRFWRKSGSIVKAVEELMAIRRQEQNPFKEDITMHEVLLHLRTETNRYFSYRDPRVGMRITTLLHRIGHPELIGMFPKKSYLYVRDLHYMKIEKMIDLYNHWQKKKHGNNPLPGTNAGVSSKGNTHAKRTEPVDVFQTIVDIVRPPLNSRNPKYQQLIHMSAAVQEFCSPQECFDIIFNAFGRRFGKNFTARATNTAIAITETAWNDYNNFKSITDTLTPAQLLRAVQSASAGSEVKTALDNVRKIIIKTQKEREAEEEDKKWDRERIKICAELLQFGVDRLRVLVEPESPLAEMIDRTLLRVASYKRKYSYTLIRLRAKLEARHAKAAVTVDSTSGSAQQTPKPNGHRKKATGNPAPKGGSSAKNTPGENVEQNLPHEHHGSSPSLAKHKTMSVKDAVNAKILTANDSANSDPSNVASNEQEHHDSWSIPVEIRSAVYTVEKSVDLPFTGKGEDSIELEKNICICKLFLELLDNFHLLTTGVQRLKRIWRGDALTRAIAKRKLDRFLDQASAEYLSYMNNNHVHAIWSKFRKLETTAYRLALIMDAVIRKKNAILEELALIARFGWIQYYDDKGYPYWVDSLAKEESTYDMPVYRFEQYKHVLRIQKRARMLLRALELRRILKESARQREIALIEARRAKEVSRTESNGSRALFVSVQIRKRLMSQFLTDPSPAHGHNSHQHQDHENECADVTHPADGTGGDPVRRNSLTGGRRSSVSGESKPVTVSLPTSIDPEMEALLPSKLRLLPAHPVFSGGWFLLQSAVLGSHNCSQFRYAVVMACKVREGGRECDVKHSTGEKQVDVKSGQLFQLNFEQGSVVEARFKGGLDFYRGKISSITPAYDGNNRYSVLYNDGERELGLTRDMIRVPSVVLSDLLKERSERVAKLEKQLMRAKHFVKLKSDRRASAKRIGCAIMDSVRNVFAGKPTLPIREVVTTEAGVINGSEGLHDVDREAQKETAAAGTAKKFGEKKIKGGRSNSVVSGTKNQTMTTLLGSSVQNMIAAAEIMRDIQSETQLVVKYIRVLRFGWIPVKTGDITEYHKLSKKQLAHVHSSGSQNVHTHQHPLPKPLHSLQRDSPGGPLSRQHSNIHSRSSTKPTAHAHLSRQLSTELPEEISLMAPVYSAAEEFAAVKMQSVVRMRIGRLRFTRELFRDSLVSIMNRAILKAKRTAFIGFGQEGLTTFLLLRRLGLWELADAIEGHLVMKTKKGHHKGSKTGASGGLNAPSLDKLASMAAKDFEAFGIKRQDLAHEVTKFQNWWNKTNQQGRDAASELVNYYADVDDPRSLKDCIRDREEYIVGRFTASFPAHEARTRVAVKRITGSTFPHGYMQIESYLQKYLQSPELARVSLPGSLSFVFCCR
jgi:hypothetical protein